MPSLPDLSPIRNIIFDLGGVILNIDYALTERAFIDLGFHEFGSAYSQLRQSDLFDRFERGELDEEGFRKGLRPFLPEGTEDAQIDRAWNAMLLDLPDERVHLLRRLGQRYRIFLLSNTNHIHVRAFEAQSAQQGVALSNLFEAAWYSCDVGMRKPEPRIFRAMTEEYGLMPSATLFIDDSPQHVEAASSCGIIAYHLTGGQRITDLFGQAS